MQTTNFGMFQPNKLLFLCVMTYLCGRVTGRINAGPNERKLEPTDISNFRFLAFGASITWGATLEDRLDAYPSVLSKDAANLAIRPTGPNYPSICTQSMVGDEIYDVIILEYFDAANDGLKTLASRLHQRFPNAVLVFLQLWYPKHMYYTGNGYNEQVGRLIREDMGLDERKPNGPGLKEALEATSPEHWKWSDDIYEKMEVLEDIAKSVGGYILKGPPFPINSYTDIDKRELLLSTLPFFAQDWFHLSKEGHSVIAEAVKQFLQTIPLHKSNEVGPWVTKDICNNWLNTGYVNVPFSSEVTLNMFKPGKYALEFPLMGGNLQITNPFETSMFLTLSYMTTGPMTTIYPKTEMKINGEQTVIIDPICNHYDFPVHVSLSKRIGKLQPGENVVTIRPQETVQQPFRIISLAITSGNDEFSVKFSGGVV